MRRTNQSRRPYNSRYDSTPEQYELLRSCWLNEYRLQFIVRKFETYGLPACSSVLEIGSGTGRLLNLCGTLEGIGAQITEPVHVIA